MKKPHEILFGQKMWKGAFSVMPLEKEYVYYADKASDLPVIRVRASEYNRENTAKRRITVSIDLDEKTARIIAYSR